MSIGGRIAHVRGQLNRSAREVSLAAGLSPNTVSELEKDPNRSPSVKTLKAIADQLRVSDVWLMNGDTDNHGPAGFSESDAVSWSGPPIPGVPQSQSEAALQRTIRSLAPSARHPSTLKLRRNMPDFGLVAGDVLVIDLNSKAADGDVVVANVTDLTTGSGVTIVRRLFSPYLIAASITEREPSILADGTRTSIMGVVKASFRAPDIV